MMANKHISPSDFLDSHRMTLPYVTKREYREKEIIYSQGEAADALFSIRSGGVKLMVTACNGKRAVLRIMGEKRSSERNVWVTESSGERRRFHFSHQSLCGYRGGALSWPFAETQRSRENS